VTLALAILASLAVAALVARWAARSATRWRPLQTLLVALAPLAAFAVLVRSAPPRSGGYALRVTGQYAPLADTITLGGAGADVRLPVATPGAGGARVRLWYDRAARLARVRVDSGLAPVSFDGRPVNALPLAHGTRVTLQSSPGLTVTAALPAWPAGCLLRVERLCAERALTVTDGETVRQLTVRVGRAGVPAGALDDPRLARAPFLLMTAGRRVWVVANPAGPVRVDGQRLPSAASAPADGDPGEGRGPELRVGAGVAAAALRVRPDTLANRLALDFVGRTRGERWALATDGGRVVHRVVAGTAAGPGTLRLLDLDAEAPLGPRARPYAGALEWTGRELRWHTGGTSRVLRANVAERLPGIGPAVAERGHLVEIAAPGVPRGALLAAGAVWAAGALLLALAASGEGAPVGALRVLVLGLVYTLALVRLTLAWRVSAAPPYNVEALPWAALFLATFPLLVFLLERWPLALGTGAEAGGRIARALTPAAALAGVARGRRAAAVAELLALAAVAGTLAVAAGPLRMQGSHLLLGTFVLVAGTAGLLLLQRVLVAGEAGALVHLSPVGMLLPRAERGFGARQMWRAFTALLVVLGLYVALAWSIRGVPSPLLAVAYGSAAGLAYAFVWARERVRPRVPLGRLAAWVGGAAAALSALAFLAASVVRPQAGLALPLLLGAAVGAAALVAGGAALLPLARPLRGWPYRRADVLPPLGFALLPVALIFVAGWTGLRRVAITVGYALAVAALLLVVRVFAAWWHRETGRRVRQQLGAAPERLPRALLAGPLVAPLVVYLAYGVVDRGLLLLLLAAVLVAGTIAAATVGRAALAAATAGVALILGVLVPRAVAVDAELLGTRPLALATPQIRYAAVRAPDALGHQLALAGEETGREIVATLQQTWGMRAHAANGGATGGGLFSLPFDGASIPEEVALTDNAFSVFVLGEHGFAGGVAVLGAFVAFGVALLLAARVAARRVGTAHLALLLAGIAAYVAIPALYMAAANVELVPLTGQNFPLLGLRSGADVAFVAWLAALAVVALPAPPAEDDPEREDVRRTDLRRLRTTLGAVTALVGVAALGVAASAWRATHAEVPPFGLDTFAGDLRELVRRGDLVRQGDTLAVAAASLGKAGLREGDLVRALVQRSNAFARGSAAPRAACLDVVPWLTWSGAADVRVNDAGCRLGGPAAGERWRGALVAGTAPGQLVVAGLPVPVLLGEGAAARATVRCAGAGGDTVRALVVEVVCGDAAAELRGGAHPSARLTAGARVSLDGAPLGRGSRPLTRGSVLALGGTATLVVDSVPGGALGFARWRNGAVARVTAAGTPPLLASLDSVLARTVVTSSAGSGADVALTIDPALSRSVGARLAERCAALGGARGEVRRCSAIVVDPERGDVLALASWQRPGLPRPAYEPVDANFRAHRPGSVIKPIIASAVLARYPSLATLAVAQPSDTFSDAAGWPLGGRALHTARNGCEDAVITWRCFLPNSNNRFAVTLGLFGLAEEPATGDLPVLGDAAQGPPMSVDGARLDRRVALPARRPASYLASPLARNLAVLFDARAGQQAPGAFDDALWRPARDAGLVRGGAVWQRVSPATPELPVDDRAFADLRHVAGFLIGETDNRWSNAALARAVSRIATGRAVELRLVRQIGATALPAPAFDTLPFGPGRAAVLEGMRGVVRGRGTAHDVGALFASPALDLLGKTGTLESDALEPLSAFMWAGRTTAPGAALCPAAGIVVVELEPGAADRLRAAALFADAVAPALRETFGWGGTPCTRAR
jgi:cell division protein FtsW (lipid II flippase)